MAALPLTGERTVPGIPEENYWFRRHAAAYVWTAPFVAGRDVLEVGCGEGYGTALLARQAHRIVGLDYDASTVAHAASTYRDARFARGTLAAIPLRDASVDVVVTLQVIEHVWHHGEFLAECRRVLRPGGQLIVTTPNRLTFSPGLDAPVNPFHTREFTADELVDLITTHGFVVEDVLGVYAGSTLAALDAKYDGSFVAAQLASAPSDWSAPLMQDVVSVRAEDFVVTGAPAAGISECLDLVVLANRPVR